MNTDEGDARARRAKRQELNVSEAETGRKDFFFLSVFIGAYLWLIFLRGFLASHRRLRVARTLRVANEFGVGLETLQSLE